jgi:Arc/MetJ family transcription regulator
MARTPVDLDEKLLKRAMKLSGVKERTELVNRGLRSLVRWLEQVEVLKLKGKIGFEDDPDVRR